MSNYLYNYPEQYAQDIVSSFDLTPPIDLTKICEKLDIRINYEPLYSIEALLIISSGKKNIIIDNSRSLYPQRERFTIAHEIGHYIIPWHENLQQCDKIVNFESNDEVEKQANDFASELLVPKSNLLEDIKDKKVTLSLIKSLAKQYDVSLVVMARRVLEYTDTEAVVLIYYSNGKKYIQMKSKTFKEELKDGRITKSSAHKLLTSYNTSAEIKDVLESSIWFKEKGETYKIVEESMFQNNLGRVFTLLRKADNNDTLDLLWDI
ncbi:ImmA/IrrE family metallo-endopeptidase [Clostridium botulinum]|uniref:ImmA/IrrE family metallo-endopeptidase n=1 Tax=Clostridium botulinum TaxID=1491 RepID=UPI0013F7D981|nr:ImmA/IrrE family metallo-endopeptidase [Clostridium botulinum]MBY6809362.1 ImmA/IrrE family metallo-endopeptidase [Clostridium botulinum]MBY6822804.1 ImmA/IrrE family metallo-endopeptidase [Clostridium botulinum]MBY6833416.1 ImmA/IrrE family metallo-endopeptidase [Clostridium botulinum]MBY6971477.1 ImmA/IrrE family metallo-endopeptidase [Clostridium botulinum]NFO15530.1 ImmA/IrrE family metallo-endopeptidase [Clostridium botulinum]